MSIVSSSAKELKRKGLVKEVIAVVADGLLFESRSAFEVSSKRLISASHNSALSRIGVISTEIELEFNSIFRIGVSLCLNDLDSISKERHVVGDSQTDIRCPGIIG